MRRHLTLEEISAWFDGEADLGDAEQRHMRECAECGAVLDGHVRLRRLARKAAPAVPSDAIWRAISARLAPAPAVIVDREVPVSRALVLPKRRFSAADHRAASLRRLRVLALRARPFLVAVAAVAAIVLFIPRATHQPTGAPGNAPAKRVETAPSPRAARPVETVPAQAGGAGTAAAGSKVPARHAPPPAKREAPSTIPAAAKPVETIPASAPAKPTETAPSAAGGRKPAEAVETPRRSWTGERFVLTADRFTTSNPDLISAAGHVRIEPAVPGGSYFAVVDGFGRTLTGSATGVVAEVVNPGGHLILHTGAKGTAVHPVP